LSTKADWNTLFANGLLAFKHRTKLLSVQLSVSINDLSDEQKAAVTLDLPGAGGAENTGCMNTISEDDARQDVISSVGLFLSFSTHPRQS